MLGIKEVPDEALQETIREYALERLRSSGEAEEVAAVVSERCQEQVDGASDPLASETRKAVASGQSCRSHFVKVTTVLMVWLPRSWRPQRVRRPGRCLSCVGLGSFGAP
jgi:hypothetical protein